MYLSSRTKAIAAIGFAGILGGVAPIFMKIAFKTFAPVEITFLRYVFGILFFIPYAALSRKEVFKPENIPTYLICSLFYIANIFLFIIGVQYTTSTVSQLFYLLTPVFVSLISFFLFRETLSSRKVLSIVCGVMGASLLIFRSVQAGALLSSIGSFRGNGMITVGVIFWSLYIVYSKKKGKNIAPSAFIIWNFAACIFCSFFILKYNAVDPFSLFQRLLHAPVAVVLSIITLGVLNSGAMVFLYQWAIKNTSSFAVSSATYLSPLSAAFFAIPFMGEKLSVTLGVSAFAIGVASYLIITDRKRKNINVV